MGKGRKFQQDLANELRGYMSPDEEDDDFENQVPEEELRVAEMNKALLLENIPVTTADKVEKLRTRLEEILRQCDEQNTGFTFHLPVDAEGSTMGFAFVYFNGADAARACQQLINGFKLGKYEIKVYPYSALDKYKNLPDEMPPLKESTFSEGVDLESWLFDGREQIVLRHGVETEIQWVDALAMGAEVKTCYAGERDKEQGKVWCRRQVMWSPSGKYLATFHNQGVVIWGGKEFQRVSNFAHPNVTHGAFSPCERFLVTFVDDGLDGGDNKDALVVWNVRSSTKLKAFSDPRKDGKQVEWPYLKWSQDGAYFARAVENGISVFSSSTMKLVDGKPVPVRGIHSFDWSPKDNLVAYWCPEEGDVPARVALFDPITKRELKSKNLFNVSTVKLHWHSNGDFLCAQVTRHTKTKKTTFTNFEVFRVRDNGCPNETLNMYETVAHFSFEPAPAFRFAVVHSEQPDGGIKAKMNVSIYSLTAIKGGSKLELLQTLEGRVCQETHWSPQGGILVLASLDYSAQSSLLPPGAPQPFNGPGAFEFYDVDAKQSLAHVDHYMANEIRWDPSGRFVATIATQPMFGEVAMKFTLENGYKLWSFQGQKLNEQSLQDFYQLLWRPRPKTLLGEEEQAEIRKKLPQIIKRFEKDDEWRRKQSEASKNAARVKQLLEFRNMMQERRQRFAEYQKKRAELGYIPRTEPKEYTEIVEKTEELVSEKIEVVSRFK